MAPENIIQIKQLNFSYADGHQALKDITLDIRRGEVFGIIGPTGAGKSTLLQHLNGILIGQGEILVDDEKIAKDNSKSIRQKVGIVFQNPDDQLFCPTVYEDIAFGLINLGFNKQEIEQKTADMLDRMELSHLRDLSSHHLSFGEKKRVAIATTLVMNPQIIALDEPFANLDYKSILNIIAIIRALTLTRVIISQDVLLTLSICDRIAILDHGKIVKVAFPQEIADDQAALSGAGLDFRAYLDLIKRFV
jgi:cobalt/nickel transport system ATP-binding protein